MGGLFRCILSRGDAGPFYSNILFLYQVFLSRDSPGKEVDVTFPALLLPSFKKIFQLWSLGWVPPVLKSLSSALQAL